MTEQPEEGAKFSFTDKRKVDPVTGAPRTGDGSTGSAEESQAENTAAETSVPASDEFEREVQAMIDEQLEADENAQEQNLGKETADETSEASECAETEVDEVEELKTRIAELEEERKRDQAEYVNSRRRIEAAGELRTQQAVGRVLSSLVSVLDDIDRGRTAGHFGEDNAFAPVAKKLEDTLEKQGLKRFGEVGEEFDPEKHEALMHEDSDEYEVNTVATVLQAGYMLDDKVLRPARVATKGPQ